MGSLKNIFKEKTFIILDIQGILSTLPLAGKKHAAISESREKKRHADKFFTLDLSSQLTYPSSSRLV